MKNALILMLVLVSPYVRAEDSIGRVGSLKFSNSAIAKLDHSGEFLLGYYEKGLEIEGNSFPYRIVEKIPPIHELLVLTSYGDFERLLGKPRPSGGLNFWGVKEKEYKGEIWNLVAVKDGNILLLQVLGTFSRHYSDTENDAEWNFEDLSCKICLLKKGSRHGKKK